MEWQFASQSGKSARERSRDPALDTDGIDFEHKVRTAGCTWTSKLYLSGRRLFIIDYEIVTGMTRDRVSGSR